MLVPQNDPSVPEGAGPKLSPELAKDLQQDESSGRAQGFSHQCPRHRLIVTECRLPLIGTTSGPIVAKPLL